MTQTPLWTIRDICEAVSAQSDGHGDISGISFNSKDVRPGHLFVALKGHVTDGHAYVKEAFIKGAKAALVSEDIVGLKNSDPRLLFVEDTLKALWVLASASRLRMKGQVVAITGSAGKTTTKEALHRSLSRGLKSHANKKSFNNHVGVPLSLARMPADSEVAVFELGMNGPNEIGPLSKLVKPDIAIITSIGLAHRAGFEQDEEIALAKAEIFEGMTKEGIVILPDEITHKYILNIAALNANLSKVITVPAKVGEGLDVDITRLVAHSNCSCLTANVFGEKITFKVGIPGEHALQNALLILAAVKVLGGDLALAGITLGEMLPLKGRGRSHPLNYDEKAFTLIDDSYNANVLSMAASIKTLSLMEPLKSGRRIAVLGEMNELGEVSQAQHLALGQKVEDAGVDILIGVGLKMEGLVKNCPGGYQKEWFESRAGITKFLLHNLRNGDVILVKGATYLGLEEIVNSLIDLDESENIWEGESLSQAAE